MRFLDNKMYLDSIKKVALNNQVNFDKFNNSSILITGASGLICSFLVDVLMYRNNNLDANITIYMLCRNEEKLLNRFSCYEIEKYNGKNRGNLVYIIQDVCNKFEFDIHFDYIIHLLLT